MNKTKIKLKKGDNVLVLTGKDKGKSGSILSIIPEKNRAIVKGVNIVKKHQKPSKQSGGGIIEKELSIQLSNLAFISIKDGRIIEQGDYLYLSKRDNFVKNISDKLKII